jgi:hypothetical protein
LKSQQIKKQIKSESLFSHDVVKIFSGDFSAVSGCSLEHFFELSTVHCLSEFLCDSFDVINIDEACFVVIEQVKNFIDTVLCLGIKILLIPCRPIWQ